MKQIVTLLPLLLVLAGCATPYRAPSDVAHIKLDRVDSPTVAIDKIWLERKSGPLVVKGCVLQQSPASDTTQTHLDVTLFDVQGNPLRSTVDYFEPRKLVRRYQNPSHGIYQIPLDPLPSQTARIEVRAHEGKHTGS